MQATFFTVRPHLEQELIVAAYWVTLSLEASLQLRDSVRLSKAVANARYEAIGEWTRSFTSWKMARGSDLCGSLADSSLQLRVLQIRSHSVRTLLTLEFLAHAGEPIEI